MINLGDGDVGTGTGAVIGFIKSGVGIGLLVGLIILVLGGVIVLRRKSPKNE